MDKAVMERIWKYIEMHNRDIIDDKEFIEKVKEEKLVLDGIVKEKGGK